MRDLYPLLPAFGRDYKSSSAAIADFLADKDFACAGGSYTNRADLLKMRPAGERVSIRYARLTRVCVFPLGREPKPKTPKRARGFDLATADRAELLAELRRLGGAELAAILEDDGDESGDDLRLAVATLRESSNENERAGVDFPS